MQMKSTVQLRLNVDRIRVISRSEVSSWLMATKKTTTPL